MRRGRGVHTLSFPLRLAVKSCRKLAAVMTKCVFVAVIGTLTQRFVFFMLFYSVLLKTALDQGSTDDCDLSFANAN